MVFTMSRSTKRKKNKYTIFLPEKNFGNQFMFALLSLPDDILDFFLSLHTPLEFHVLRFVSKRVHRLAHRHAIVNALPFVTDSPQRILDLIAKNTPQNLPLFQFFRYLGCYWCENTMSSAASGGSVEIIK